MARANFIKHFFSLRWVLSHLFIGMLLLAGLMSLYPSAWVDNIRHQAFDFYQRLSPREPTPGKMAAPVAVIDIDELSLKEIGQWPWSRTTLATLVERLTEYGVAVVGFDMIFSEADRTSPRFFVAEHKELPPAIAQALSSMPDNEQVFADAISKGRVVLGQIAINQEISAISRKVGYGFKSPNKDELILPYLNRHPGLVRNRPELEEAAKGVGLFSTTNDPDGTFRRVALIEQVGNQTYPSLSLEMLRVALGGKDDYLVKGYKDKPGVQSVVVKTANPKAHYEIPTDERARVFVHFARYETQGGLYISARDVLNKTVQDADKRLRGALVIIGTTAAGLKDIRKTPISGNLPGVEMHAQLLETILSNTHLTRPFQSTVIELSVILFGGLMLVFFVPRVRAIYNLILCITLIGVLIIAAWHFYQEKQVLVDASYPGMVIFTMFIILSYMNYMREEKERQKVKTAFGHYVSPALLEEIAKNPEKLTLGGETRHITIMFSDIRGFTTISEQFDAQGLTNFINGYLTPMTNIIMSERGTIDKYMGDAIMAFWNAPLDDDEHALHASIAALKMQEAVKSLNVSMAEKAQAAGKKHIPISIGVGLNSGNCCVGNMGSDQRFDYSALGDDVNLASRLEGQSKTYGVDVVVGQNTAQLLAGRVALIELDLIQVKGKTEPVTIYALVADESQITAPWFTELHSLQNQLLTAYRNREWQSSILIAGQMSQKFPQFATLAELYIERSEAYSHTPPPTGWKGEYIATSK